MADDDQAEQDFNTMTNRMLRREALRRAAADLNSTSPPALEHALANISAEVTAEAAERIAAARAKPSPPTPPPPPHPSKP
jgi:phage shock protein A